MSRVPLSDKDRAALRAREESGDESMHCTFDDGLVLGCSGDPTNGDVLVEWPLSFLSPDEARREAQALLAAADHAEFGGGEWRDGEWHRDVPHDPPAGTT